MHKLTWIEKLKQAAASIHAERIDELAVLDTEGVILEIGTGSGHLLTKFTSAGCRVVGLDLSLALLRKSRPAPCAVADAQHLPFAGDSFSAVVCCHSLEHMPNLPSVLAEVARVLKFSGHLIVVYPYEPICGITLIGNLSTWPEFWKVHRHKFTPRRLRQVVTLHGLTHLASRMYLGYNPMYISCFIKR